MDYKTNTTLWGVMFILAKKVIVDKFFWKGKKKGVPKSAHLEKLICYDNEWTTGL